MKKVGFLKVMIEPDKIKMEKEKMKRVLNWLTSQEVKDIQKFLVLTNYYQWFIKDFVFIPQPLYSLVKKDQKCNWTEKQEKVFRKLKERFTKELVLEALDFNKR